MKKKIKKKKEKKKENKKENKKICKYFYINIFSLLILKYVYLFVIQFQMDIYISFLRYIIYITILNQG